MKLIEAPSMEGFHFHIYYDNKSKQEAIELSSLCQKTLSPFGISVGKMKDHPVGPHTKPMFQLTSDRCYIRFSIAYNLLLFNRKGLSVLIHPLTNNELEAHTTMAVWMGKEVPLDLDKL